MPKQPKVTIIPAKTQLFVGQSTSHATRRRVAGYARVSTDKDEQLNSYEAQVDYYTNYIKSRPDWEFVDVYTDEGISALNTKKRDGFNKMISDALDGKIDLIVTKSVSRFARNTVDSLSTIRKLKEKGVEVYFEKEGIWTFDGKGELLITIMSSLAQEESRSISENVTWGKRKSMEDGKVSLPWSSFLGYTKGEDGTPIIVPDEAVTVQMIYRQFMEGKSYTMIAKWLTAQGISTPMGKKEWGGVTVANILKNETYMGSKLMQKTLTTNYLTKAQKPNEGELPFYHVENSHDYIIHPDDWEAVQAEIARRKALGTSVRCHSPLATKIKCGCCGAWFGSKVWHSNSKYRSVVWRCNARYKDGGRECQTSHVREDAVKAEFVTAFNILLQNSKKVIASCRRAQTRLCDITAIDTELAELNRELEVLEGLVKQAIRDGAEWDAHLQRHDSVKNRLDELEKQKAERIGRGKTLEVFIRNLERNKQPTSEFDVNLWLVFVDHVVVEVDGNFTFKFKNGI